MRRAASFLVLFGAGMLVYFVGGYQASMTQNLRTTVKILLPLLLLLLTYTCARVERLRPWKPVCLALLAASCGFLAAWMFSDAILGALGATPTDAMGVALAKLSESALIVVAVLIVARAGRFTAADLYLQRGKVRVWAPVGIASFGVFGALFLRQWSGQGLTTSALVEAAPWIIVFIFANAFMEELHFRGLLLRPFEGRLGAGGANVCIALFFTLSHAPVRYVPDIAPFLIVLFVLAWAWGLIIQRTGALWGAVLFHAAADLTIVVGIFKTYGGM